MSSCSAASRREAPPSTRAITRMRMSAEYAFGMVRPPDESMPPDSPTYRSLGTLRFYSARTCSSTLQLALTILLEDFRREYCGGEIVLSAHTTRMPSATRSRAARELVELGLVKLKQTGRGALRVTWVAS